MYVEATVKPSEVLHFELKLQHAQPNLKTGELIPGGWKAAHHGPQKGDYIGLDSDYALGGSAKDTFPLDIHSTEPDPASCITNASSAVSAGNTPRIIGWSCQTAGFTPSEDWMTQAPFEIDFGA